MNEASLLRLLGLSFALLIGTAPTSALAATGAVPAVVSAEESTEAARFDAFGLTTQETAVTQELDAQEATAAHEDIFQRDAAESTSGNETNDNYAEEGQSDGAGAPTDGRQSEEAPVPENAVEPTKPETGVFTNDGKLYYRLTDGSVLRGKGWHKVDGSWYYAMTADGAFATGWLKLGGTWYWLDPETGIMATGVVPIKGEHYVFSGSGAMLTGWQKSGGKWYYLKSSGAAATGWKKLGGAWYWLDPETGIMATGLITVNGTSYLLRNSGAMLTGWQKVDGTWYYLKSSGAMAKGWQKLGGTWYWLDTKTGAMATGWKLIGNTWYYFNGSGSMLTGWQKLGGMWYYLKSSGAMATGWQKSGGKWYWLDQESGVMKTGWLKLGDTWYWMDASGAALQNQIKVINGVGYAFDSSCACHYGSQYDYSNESVSSKQQAIVNACRKVPSPGAGLCSEWVSQVFAYCGYPHLALDACDMANDFCWNSDRSQLKPGMLIAVKTHSHTWAGSIWGHVCIYIGNGKVMDNVGYIRMVDLDSWLWWYGTTVTPKWGWYNKKALG